MKKMLLMTMLLTACGGTIPVVEDSGSKPMGGGATGGGEPLGGGSVTGGGSATGGGAPAGGGSIDAGTGGGMPTGGGSTMTGGSMGGSGGGMPMGGGSTGGGAPDAGPSCGLANQACCATGIACSGSLTCQNGTCSDCGAQGQNCCGSGTQCAAITNYCSPNTTCQSCGGEFQPCCDSGNCNSGFTCQTTMPNSQGICRAPGATCGGTQSGSSQTCCYDANSSAQYCNAGFRQSGSGGGCLCSACGGSNQLACEGNQCKPGFSYDPVTGRCKCGGIGQACCAPPASTQCLTSGATCGSSGTCEAPDAGTSDAGSGTACGDRNEPCCTGQPVQCRVGNACVAGTCQMCGGSGQPACTCGGPYQQCCLGNACAVGTCFTQFSTPQCSSQPCGGLGQNCCSAPSSECPSSPMHSCEPVTRRCR